MDNPVIGFGIAYGGELKYCEAMMQDTHYDIYFDQEWIAAIIHDDNWDWRLSSGAILPQSIINEIGLRIESHYN